LHVGRVSLAAGAQFPVFFGGQELSVHASSSAGRGSLGSPAKPRLLGPRAVIPDNHFPPFDGLDRARKNTKRTSVPRLSLVLYRAAIRAVLVKVSGRN
jgi:hypothetical protein